MPAHTTGHANQIIEEAVFTTNLWFPLSPLLKIPGDTVRAFQILATVASSIVVSNLVEIKGSELLLPHQMRPSLCQLALASKLISQDLPPTETFDLLDH